MAKLKKINFKSKKTWKNILVIGLACLTIVGAIVGLSALFRKGEETTKVINPTYAVGGLTEDGRYKETEESIYTKDAFECMGLDVEIDFRSNISYRLFFYDENNAFVDSSSNLTTNYDSADELLPFGTKYCRIVITPNEDDKISWYEKGGYAEQLTISVSKEQDKAINVMPQNMLVLDETQMGYALAEFNAGSEFKTNEMPNYNTSEKINVAGSSLVKLIAFDGNSPIASCYHFVDSNNCVVSGGFYQFVAQDNGTMVCELEIPASATGLYVAVPNASIDTFGVYVF